MKLIVGLGNPGRIYKYCRHNIGFLVIDKLAKGWGIKIKPETRIKACLGRGCIEGKEVVLAKPLSFMNLSGYPVNLLFKKYNFKPQDMLVVFDDLDLDWGKIRLRTRGGSGGHKGVESIIQTLSSRDFPRLRFGIGRPKSKPGVSDYVLSRWTSREKKELAGYLETVADCCTTWMACGINKAMNKFN
ncbi:MAG: aminoacyl-tRNA hydrolase [Candidatus Omnitrophica bacterium]|nr:aminoacyl-tRNA hydrolase [Candidatus Omnitrophota bacterium]MBU1871258.1 aminoacyl-tRNA hydrolase [Candidatus Omnitrophota bacterium]